MSVTLPMGAQTPILPTRSREQPHCQLTLLAARAQLDPDRRMIAGLGFVAHPGIHARLLQIRAETEVEQQVINTEPGITRPMIAKIVPERVDALLGIQVTNSIDPALRQQLLEIRPRFRLQQRVLEP
ncbi:hypothetical protein D3C80_1744100 [compost metagenome]